MGLGGVSIPAPPPTPAPPAPKPLELAGKVFEAPTLRKKLLTETSGSMLSQLRIPINA